MLLINLGARGEHLKEVYTVRKYLETILES